MRTLPLGLLSLLVLSCLPPVLMAQDSYEIQVYGAETIPRGRTMLEFHTNFTFNGVRVTDDGTFSSHHALHETVEVTHGFTSWFEVGFYTFASLQPDGGAYWVGNHLRPRVRVPDSWHWPVGVSLSQEIGYVRPEFSADTWSWEIRPIVDRRDGRFYWALNPALEVPLSGPGHGQVVFAPNAKVALDVSRVVTLGVEYYGSLGPLGGFDPAAEQAHQIFPALDLDLGPDWEVNAGVGFGLTSATDPLIAKLIIGRRF